MGDAEQLLQTYAHWAVQAAFVLWITAYATSVMRRLRAVTFKEKEAWNYIQPLLRDPMCLLAKRENADWQAILALVRERELAKLQFARPVPNNLLLLGLLGTVVGLSLTVWGLMPVLSDSYASYEQVRRQLQDSLQHMSTAFVCTCAGLVGALLVSRAAQAKTRELMELLPDWNRKLLFKIAEETPFLTAAVVDELKKTISVFDHNLSPKVGDLSSSVSDLHKAIDSLAPSIKEASKGFNAALEEAKKALQQSIGKLTTASQEVGQSVQALKQSSEQLKTQHQELLNAHKEVVTAFSEWRGKVDELIEGHKQRISELQKQFDDSATKISNEIVNTSTELKETAAAFREAAKAFHDEGMKIQSAWQPAFQGVETLLQQVKETLERLFQEDVERLFSDHRFALDEIVESVKSIKGAIDEAKNALQEMKTQTTDVLPANGDLVKLIEALNALREAILQEHAQPLQAMSAPTDSSVHAVVHSSREGAPPSATKAIVRVKPIKDTQPESTGEE